MTEDFRKRMGPPPYSDRGGEGPVTSAQAKHYLETGSWVPSNFMKVDLPPPSHDEFGNATYTYKPGWDDPRKEPFPDFVGAHFSSLHPFAGYWRIGSMRLSMDRRPNWFHRLMTHLVFGWVWEDAA